MSFTSHFDCPICGQSEKDIPFYGFSYCNHPICAVCAIKLQKFSKDDGKSDCDYSKCVICKQDISKIIIASSIKQYEDFDEKKLLCDTKYALLFESSSAQKYYKSIIEIVCPQCKAPHENIYELMVHMQIHKRRYCELCTEFNKCLHFELEIYTDNDYHNHRIKKHPKCKFCEVRYYDDTQLIQHVKETHFPCDICHRRQGFNAYSTQMELLKHYSRDHFVCEICRANNNINVFESEYNLKTHKVSAHAFSLVGEGLVNVGFGDRDNLRYGARRRARDQDDGFFAEPPATVDVPQTIPTMNCEQEFPRLTADTQVNQQLGMQSLTLDENDARTAFSSSRSAGAGSQGIEEKSITNKPAQISGGSKLEKMADNFAISVKRSAGNLNAEDFPSLLSSGNTSERPSRPTTGLDLSKAVKTNSKLVTTQSNNKSFINRNEEDFPSLSGGGRSKQIRSAPPAQNGSWNALVKPGTSNKANKPTRNHNNRNGPENSTAAALIEEHETIEPPVERPKMFVMSPEEFQSSTNQSTAANQHQTVPDERDFPSLGASTSSVSSTANSWGKSTSISNADSVKPVGRRPLDKFILDSKSDFPGLPSASSQSSRLAATKKGKTGFASAASRPGKPQAVSKSSNSSSSTPAPVSPPKIELDCAFEHAAPSKQPASLRGIDYIPSVAPTKDPIIVVDSKQFSIMKQAKHDSHAATAGTQFSLNKATNDDEFPSMPISTQPTSNHFDVLADNVDDRGCNNEDDAPHSSKKNKKKDAVKIAPKLTSESDFPSLGAPKGKKSNRPIAVETGPKPREPNQPVPREKRTQSDAPVVSLMDVAMSVAGKRYISFPDNDERNQSMCVSLFGNLNENLATQFLQLSNLYRTRKLSVQDYLDSLQTDFIDNLDFISSVLPQMCVLLPDIPLQRSLMGSMPKNWSKDLRECAKCNQVLLLPDVALHNQLAH